MTNADTALNLIRESGASRPFVAAQLGQSLDGRIALPTGESKYINGPAALDHLHRLRAAVDAVVVGIGTVMSDDPQLTVRRVRGANPARIIIDPNARLLPSSRCLSGDGSATFVLRREGCNSQIPAPARPIYLRGDETGFSCKAIIHALAQHGFRRLLVEGGANTVSRFFEEGQLDRLHILVGPVFLGAGKTGLNFQSPRSLACAVRVEPDIYNLGGGEILIDCPLSKPRQDSFQER